ncbi:MAG: hypothetical protein JW940_03855 [Polyangiaceae bacterium]|nr:hypothetical protein [Polyangiaceae bacterium]
MNLAGPYLYMADVAELYDTREAGETQVKVVLMDGGTWDTIRGNGSDASVNGAANAFEQFLSKVASDGTVEHIVYFLVPELPLIPGVAALRPRVRQACEQSVVPCHFLDLQPLWADPDPDDAEYTDSSGIQASAEGARVIADEIWRIMQTYCIAQ